MKNHTIAQLSGAEILNMAFVPESVMIIFGFLGDNNLRFCIVFVND